MNSSEILNYEELSPEMKRDRLFINVVVATNLIDHFSQRWLDEDGYIPYYEFVSEVVDKMMFTKGSEYLAYMNTEEGERNDWSEDYGTCFDWFYIDKARELAKEFLGDDYVSVEEVNKKNK